MIEALPSADAHGCRHRRRGHSTRRDRSTQRAQDAQRGQATRRGRSTQRGQATVELVLILPVVVVLALSIVQVGIIVRERVVLAHVARESARQAAVDPRLDAAMAAARAASGLDPERLSVSLKPGAPDPRPGDRLTVEVGYRSPTDVPLIGGLIGDVVLRTDVVVRVE